MTDFKFTEAERKELNNSLEAIKTFYTEEYNNDSDISFPLFINSIESIIQERGDGWCKCSGVVMVMRDHDDNPRCHKCGNIIKEEVPTSPDQRKSREEIIQPFEVYHTDVIKTFGTDWVE